MVWKINRVSPPASLSRETVALYPEVPGMARTDRPFNPETENLALTGLAQVYFLGPALNAVEVLSAWVRKGAGGYDRT
jgi:hypothetical protein